MILVDRFIEFHNWSSSQKTLLLTAFMLPFHLILSPIGLYLNKQWGLFDQSVLKWIVVSGVLVIAVCMLLAWVECKARREGRWVVYLLVIAYVVWEEAMLVMWGFWPNAILAASLLNTLLIGLWFDEKMGWFTLGIVITSHAAYFIILHTGTIPYAPAVLHRDIDVQATLNYNLIMLPVLGAYFFMTFVLGMLTVATRMAQDVRLKKANELIRRYAPAQVADKILAGEHGEEFKPERVKLTIFFSDIVGFTQASDQLEPEELAGLLNDYLSAMAEIAEKHGATINQFVGDGIMLFFGAPHATDDRDHARRAVRMALEMQSRITEMNDVWLEHGVRAPFRARMGINTGHASVGDYGSEGRKVYSAVGIQTNLAARIQDHCEPGKVLISDTTWALVKDDFEFEDKGELSLKGVHYPVRVYEVIPEGRTSSA